MNDSAPLAGIRVIDFGRFIAAPYAGMLLADFGADVIRVERREGGEDRVVGPVTPDGLGGMFINLNRNKRGMTLDLGHQASRPIVERLIKSADVVILNLPPGVLRKLKLDEASLRQLKSDLILVTATAFGSTGPEADRVGFDSVAQAKSGAMSLMGFPGPPVRSLVPFADYGTALHAAFGAMAALYRRRETGQGALVDVSLLATSVAFMYPFLAERAHTPIRRSQAGNTGFYTSPSDTYATSDGWVMIPTIGDWMFGRWARLVEREEWIDDPRFADDVLRAEQADEIGRVASDWCAARTTEEAVTALLEARIPAAPVNSLDDALADPQIAALDLLGLKPTGDDPNAVPLARTPVTLDPTPPPAPTPPPQLGEHTDQVLAELGYSAEEIRSFHESNVV